jgi:hypothetical protein
VASDLQYAVDFQDSLSTSGAWQTLTSFAADTEGIATVEDYLAAPGSSRAYRVRCVGSHGEIATEPWGGFRVALEPGDYSLARPFTGRLVYRAQILNATSDWLTLEGELWMQEMLVLGDGIPSHVARVVEAADPALVGQSWMILTQDTEGIGVELGELGGRLQPGDTVEIRRLTSIADLFGHGFSRSARFPAGDELIIHTSSRGPAWVVGYADGTTVPLGYYVENSGIISGPSNGVGLALLPNERILWQRTIPGIVDLSFFGPLPSP